MTDVIFTLDTPDGCILRVRVHPGARRNAITGIHGGAVKISVTAPPIEGRASEALIVFLCEALHLPRTRINLIAGATSRTKILRIEGKSAAELQAALSPTVDC